MKTARSFALFAMGIFALNSVIPSANAQAVSGAELEIGPTGSNQASGPSKYNGAIGQNNIVSGLQAFSVGESNQALGTSNIAFGNTNYIWTYCGFVAGSSNTVESYSSAFALGSCNYVWGEQSLAVGFGNYIIRGADDEMSISSVALGQQNSLSGLTRACLAVGINNYVDAFYDDYYQYNEAASVLGRGLINYWKHSTIVGHYNNSSLGYAQPLLFAVGNGDDSSHRSNALEVYDDGTIKMSRQGDILMGEFGVPEP